MNAAARVTRLERVVSRAVASTVCPSCSSVDLVKGTGVVAQAILLDDDEGFDIVHCMGCATTYRGRVVERSERGGLVLTNVTHGELPV